MTYLKQTLLASLLLITVVSANGQTKKDPQKLIQQMQEATGGWEQLYALRDVEFDYKYHYPGPDIKDLSVERYIFEGEKSGAKYSVHQINVFPKTEGEIIQYYDGKTSAVTRDGQPVTDESALGLATFLRKANYFWFVMNFKLDDPGAVHQYEGTEVVNGISYDKISIGYKSDVTGKPQNDAYIVYINPETKLIDRFYFSLPAQGVNQPIILMEVDYSTHNGVKLPTTRRVYMPDPKSGKLSEKPALIQTSSNLKFNNGFTDSDLKF